MTIDQIKETASDRNATIKTIKAALKARTGINFSVRGSRGTSWGWITIKPTPASKTRKTDGMILAYAMGEKDQREISIPASSDYRAEHISAALGQTPFVIGAPYWD